MCISFVLRYLILLFGFLLWIYALDDFWVNAQCRDWGACSNSGTAKMYAWKSKSTFNHIILVCYSDFEKFDLVRFKFDWHVDMDCKSPG